MTVATALAAFRALYDAHASTREIAAALDALRSAVDVHGSRPIDHAFVGLAVAWAAKVPGPAVSNACDALAAVLAESEPADCEVIPLHHSSHAPQSRGADAPAPDVSITSGRETGAGALSLVGNPDAINRPLPEHAKCPTCGGVIR